MKENIKGLLLVLGAIAVAVGGYFLLNNENYKGYSIFCFALSVVLLGFGIKFIIDGRNPQKVYESNVRNILNTFDSIMVKSNSVPKLEGRNIIYVDNIDDMVDAQLEIRKPICFYKQTESCSFVLLDDKEAYIYIEKLNPDVIAPIEIEINENKLKNKNAAEMDSEMLRDIEKTTIVKLSNKKSYKVSPIRKQKENKFKLEEEIKKEDIKDDVNNSKVVDTKMSNIIDDAEVL